MSPALTVVLVISSFGILCAELSESNSGTKIHSVKTKSKLLAHLKHKDSVRPISKEAKRNVLTDANYVWLDGRVPFVFDTNMPAFTKLEILAAMQEIEMSTYSGGKHCIMYVPRSSENDYVHISWTSGSQGSASIGRFGGRQDMTVDSTSTRGHDDNLFELLVTLGLVPEIMRQDRDDYIEINITNAASTEPFRILTGEGSSTFGQPFDYDSLLLETPYVYAKDQAYPVTSAIEDGHVLGQSISLSRGDVNLLQNAYKCALDSSNVVNILGDMVLSCHFHNDLCTLQQDANDDFDWTVESGPTAVDGTGPNADYSSGSGKFALAKASSHNDMVARLNSPLISAGQYCLRVQIHMYGKDAGKFRITMDAVGNTLEVIHQSGPLPSNNWFYLYSTVKSRVDFTLNFEVTIGEGDQGDIAMDDLYLYNGECIEW